jgi:hypothetical protein
MEVALSLSSQKPGESDNCLSFAILDSLFSTSKKSPQNRYAIFQSLYLFYCHKSKGKFILLNIIEEFGVTSLEV